jgi:hypothetical protein
MNLYRLTDRQDIHFSANNTQAHCEGRKDTINTNFEERECEGVHWIKVVQDGLQWRLYSPQASDSCRRV